MTAKLILKQFMRCIFKMEVPWIKMITYSIKYLEDLEKTEVTQIGLNRFQILQEKFSISVNWGAISIQARTWTQQ